MTGAPAFGSIGTHLFGSSGTASFAVPTGVAADDVIVIPIFIDVAARSLSSLAAGFAHAEGSPVVGASNSLAVVWKRATGADSGTYDFTLDASTYRAGSAIRYTGCINTGSPWDSPISKAFEDINGTITPAVNVTTLGPDRLLAFYATNWSGGNWTPPTSFTERLDTGDQVITADDLVQAAAGASGSVTATCVGNDKRIAWLGALIGTTGAAAPPAQFYVSIPLPLLQQFATERARAFLDSRNIVTTGTATAALGALTAAATGTPTVNGTATSALGALAATATGTGFTPDHTEGRPTPPLPLVELFATERARAFLDSRTAITVTGTAAAVLGALTAAATGTPTVNGTAAAALGALTATATGTGTTPDLSVAAPAPPLPLLELFATERARAFQDSRIVAGGSVSGTGAATLGALAAAAIGTPTVNGTAAAALGALTATAAGRRAVNGTGSAALGGLGAAAASVRATSGSGAAALGGLLAAATVTHGAMTGNVHGPSAVAVGSVIVHTGTIAGAVT